MNSERILIKVGTSTLTHESGRINLHRVEQLCKVLCDLQNSGRDVILVSSGAVGVGIGKLSLKERPTEIRKKQATAAVGQCELMFMYDKFFGEYNHIIAQILLTRRTIETQHTKQNVINTVNTLLEMGVIPIVNENDTVAIDEIEGENFGDNDMLSAIVSKMLDVDKLIILTDIDGLYDKNPRTNSDAQLISVVDEITDEIKQMAGGTGSNRGTGGMATKLLAAEFATSAGIETRVINGSDPHVLYDIFDGKEVGTKFTAKK
ncbi:MAG: glutamate 5-kinase [Acutalibacteraceae bacterium]